MWHGWVLLAKTCMLLLSCEWKEQCLETSQAVINVLSWKYYVVPPCSPAAQLQTLSTVQHQQAGDSSLHLSRTKMAGLHALTFATGGVVLYSDASCGQEFVFCFACLACVFLTLTWNPWHKKMQPVLLMANVGSEFVSQVPVECCKRGNCVCGVWIPPAPLAVQCDYNKM